MRFPVLNYKAVDGDVEEINMLRETETEIEKVREMRGDRDI